MNEISMLDHGLVLFVGAVLPLISLIFHLASRGEEPSDLRRSYRHTMLVLWGTAILIILVWAISGRPWEELGFAFTTDLGSYLSIALALATSGFLFFQYLQVVLSNKAREKVIAQIEKTPALLKVLPKTSRDYRSFKLLGVTAGITEEIIFRGFLIWGLSLWFDLWLASVLALIVFVLSHLYQESMAELVKIAFVGAIFTVLYLMSGSLITAIFTHIMIDLLSVATLWHARQRIQTQS